MNINVNDIFDFYELRIKSHVAAVNYFASLLGYHFPEHDGDKVIEPIRVLPAHPNQKFNRHIAG